MFAVGTIARFVKLITFSHWVDVVKNGISLVIVGLLIRLPLDNTLALSLSGRALFSINFSLMISLFFIAIGLAFEFIKGLIRVGRERRASMSALSTRAGNLTSGTRHLFKGISSCPGVLIHVYRQF